MKQFLAGAAAALTFAFAATGHAQTVQAPGYMIANYDIKDPGMFQKYMDAAGSLAARYNGKVTVFNAKATAVEGTTRSVMAIAEFPSLADAQRFYSSPEYTAAKKFRIAATEGAVVITEGYVPSRQ